MFPETYKDFLVAIVTAAASFIGLLFVAMTLIADKRGKSKQRLLYEKTLAESSFIALLDLFFVAIVGLIPQANIGYVMVSMGFIGAGNSLRTIKSSATSGISKTTFSLSMANYLLEFGYGAYCIIHNQKLINVGLVVTIIMILFATALARAWELTGAHDAE